MMLRLPLPLGILVAASIAFLACSSSDFKVNQPTNDGGDETATGDTAAGDGDSLGETAPGACDDEAGVAKFCVTVQLDSARPKYDAASGAGPLNIDGKGHVFVFLYEKDPGSLKSGDPLKPKTILQYPPPEKVGAEVDVADLPITISGTAPARDYWIIAAFEDNVKDKRGDREQNLLAGDFILVPTLLPDGKTVTWPKVTLTDGKAVKLPLTLKANRRVDVTLGSAAEMKLTYKDYQVNGDGPVVFGLYDGPIEKAVFLDFELTRCINASPLGFAPPTNLTSFNTTVDGSHKLLIALIDYEFGDPFPNRGTLLAPTDAVNAPTVDISSSSWISSTKAKFTQVIDPYTAAEKTDLMHCP